MKHAIILTTFVFIFSIPAHAWWIETDSYGYQGNNYEPIMWYPASNPTPVFLPDDGTMTIPIPFPFLYYGKIYYNITIHTNGMLSFEPGAATLDNTFVPNNQPPNAALFPFWDDLAETSGIYYGTFILPPPTQTRVFSIVYEQVAVYGSLERITFQVSLFEGTNVIKFNYMTVPVSERSSGGTATIGIESPVMAGGHQTGLIYSLNEPFNLYSPLTLTFYPPIGCEGVTIPTPGPSPSPTPTFTPTPVGPFGPVTRLKNLQADTTEFPYITAICAVEDNANKRITNLSMNDFSVTEEINGGPPVNQTIYPPTEIAGMDSIPKHIVLAIDVSKEMKGSKIENMMALVNAFADYYVKGGHHLSIVTFEEVVQVRLPFTNNPATVQSSFKNIHIDDKKKTALYQGIVEAVNVASSARGYRAVIAFTGGKNTVQGTTLDMVTGLGRDADIPIYTVSAGGGTDVQSLRTISERTGGTFFANLDPVAFANWFESDVLNVYAINYTSSAPAADGSNHVVRVKVAGKGDNTQYTATSACIAAGNHTASMSTLDIQQRQYIAQNFTVQQEIELEAYEIKTQGGDGAFETYITDSAPGQSMPNVILSNTNGTFFAREAGWYKKYIDYAHVDVILRPGQQYWLVVAHKEGDGIGFEVSGDGVNAGSIALGQKDDTGRINWAINGTIQNLNFRIIACHTGSGPFPQPTAVPTATPFIPDTPTATPSPTVYPRPSCTPIPTATPTPVDPEIKMAGYWITDVSNTGGGVMEIMCIPIAKGYRQIGNVEVYYQGVNTGVRLQWFAPGAWHKHFDMPPGAPSGRYLLDLVAWDDDGHHSEPWPYLKVTP